VRKHSKLCWISTRKNWKRLLWWGVDAKDKAERILNASLLVVRMQWENNAESAKATAVAMRSEIESALTIVANNLRAAAQLDTQCSASCITMLASAVACVILR